MIKIIKICLKFYEWANCQSLLNFSSLTSPWLVGLISLLWEKSTGPLQNIMPTFSIHRRIIWYFCIIGGTLLIQRAWNSGKGGQKMAFDIGAMASFCLFLPTVRMQWKSTGMNHHFMWKEEKNECRFQSPTHPAHAFVQENMPTGSPSFPLKASQHTCINICQCKFSSINFDSSCPCI